MVTYLFGAGASCNKLPMVTNMPKRMGVMINSISDYIYQYFDELPFSPRIDILKPKVELFKKNLKLLQDAAQEHSSIDTYFKKLWLTNNMANYYTHKNTYIYYLLMEEIISGLSDIRYDTFISALLEKK